MRKLLSRILPSAEKPESIPHGIYQCMFPQDVEIPNRMQLRVEPSGNGLLLVNASIALHLNQTAVEHVYQWILGKSEIEAAEAVALRYRVSQYNAQKNQHEIREQVLRLAETPDLDPVLFIGLDRMDPYSVIPSSPYRLDCALTYRCDRSGSYDPLARERVDKELEVSEWKSILEKSWDAGIPHVTFTGGEPCLWDDLPALIAYSESLGQITGILTDGKRLDEKEYLSALDQSGLDHMLITYNPHDPASRAGLESALATDIFTAVHLIVSDESALEALEELAQLGVTSISLASESSEVLDPLQTARDHAAYIGMDLIWDLPVPYSTRNPISLELENQLPGDGRAWLYIEPDGDVLPAQGIDFILGNMLRDPWEEIWERAQVWYTDQAPVAG